MAERLGAETVVVHPPFLWQRAAAAIFAPSIAELQERTDGADRGGEHVPGEGSRRRGQQLPAALESGVRRAPLVHPGPVAHRDLGHRRAGDGRDGWAPGSGTCIWPTDPGRPRTSTWSRARGNQPCAEILEMLARNGFDGAVVVEINTRGRPTRSARWTSPRRCPLPGCTWPRRWRIPADHAERRQRPTGLGAHLVVDAGAVDHRRRAVR